MPENDSHTRDSVKRLTFSDILLSITPRLFDPAESRRLLACLLHPQPHCPGCLAVITAADSLERFYQLGAVTCAACGKRFSPRSGTPLQYWRIDPAQLITLAILHTAGADDRRVSEVLSISPFQVHSLRKRLSGGEKSEDELRAEGLLKNRRAVFLFVRERGFKISQAQLFRHVAGGKLRPTQDGRFTIADVLDYCKSCLQHAPGRYSRGPAAGALDSLSDVLLYLEGKGYKTSLPALYRARREGRLCMRRDGRFSVQEIGTFAQNCLKRKIPALSGAAPQGSLL